ncbi:MAG: glycosyltransferase family 2 protein [Bradymonadaceae bacterium]
MSESEQSELLTVVVCCLNEEENVRETVESVYDEAPDIALDLDVLLVDDGSTDDTRQVMQQLCREHETCRMLAHDENRGLGASLLRAYDHVPDGAWVTCLPGDNEFYFESIHEFLELRDEYDFILGYPANPVVRPFKRRVASRAFLEVAKALFGLNYAYLNGMHMYRIEAVRGLELEASGHAYVPELLSKAILRDRQLEVGECPFHLRGRDAGASNAFQPAAVLEAVWETGRAFRAVSEFREACLEDEA